MVLRAASEKRSAAAEHAGGATQAAQRPQRRRVDSAAPPAAPPVGAPFLDDLDGTLQAFGQTAGDAERTFKFYVRMEKEAISEKKAPEWIAEEVEQSQGSARQLCLDARRGLGPPRALVDALSVELQLDFRKHTLTVELSGGRTVKVDAWLRSLEGAARWHLRHLRREHCTPRVATNAAGERVYADPMTCEWAHEEYRKVHAIDPNGLLLSLALASDKTELCKEQTAEPVYAVNNALPLAERRQRKWWLAVAYFAQLPPSVVATLSDAQATLARKLLLRAAILELFREYLGRGLDNAAALGQSMIDATGTERNVFVRFENLIFDYPVVAAWTLTLQNRTCFCCRRVAGAFHQLEPPAPERTVASERSLVEQAWAAHPDSHAARAAFLRPYGLHPQLNPLLQLACVGLYIYSAITFSTLHMIYEGTWKVLVESTFGLLKERTGSTAAFNKLGKRIDTWVVSAIAPTPFVKTSFNKGISRYLHGAMTNEASPWAPTVKFGKITSKDTWRDIMRFWRMLLFDLFPAALGVLGLFTDYLEWVRLAILPAPTDANLMHAETYYEAWLKAAVAMFGAERFMNRIKAHAPTHLRRLVKQHGSTPFNDDALAESAHIEGAKEPWERTNHRDVNAQLARFVARRDTLRLLEQRRMQLDDTARRAAAPPEEPVSAAPAPPAVAPQNAVMHPQHERALELPAALAAHSSLTQLEFCLKLYLHLGQGGSFHTHVRDMPVLDQPTLRLRTGVRLTPRPSEPRVALGGHIVHGNVLLDPTKLAMVAIKSKVPGTSSYTIWYGQLELCFEAKYLGRWRSLCLVRWLDTPRPVVQTIAAVEARRVSAAEVTYLDEMRSAPFAAYRWSRATGSTRTGHPAAGASHYGVVCATHVLYRVPMIPLFRHAPGEPDPTFFLNTDMWDL